MGSFHTGAALPPAGPDSSLLRVATTAPAANADNRNNDGKWKNRGAAATQRGCGKAPAPSWQKNFYMDRQPHIAVVGSANIDLITYTDDFPRPGETIFGREFNLGFGGKGANQAVAARLCGATVSMVGRVGDDLFGPATIANFISRGIDASRVLVTPGVSSGVAPIFVESSGQNRIWVVKGANDHLRPEDVDGAADLLRRADMIAHRSCSRGRGSLPRLPW